MSRSLVRWSMVAVLAGLCAFVLVPQMASAKFIENFDGGGSVPYALSSTSGTPASIDVGGGSSGSFARITNLDGSNNNSIAWDEDPGQTGPSPGGLRFAFDFRMTDDQANADAGGCCGSGADGMGIGLYSTATYGTTGPINPADGGGAWERPAHPDAFAIGLDIFQNIDVVSLNWGGAQAAEADVQADLDLNSGVFHRAVVTLSPSGSDALVDMTIIEDVQGITAIHEIFSGQLVSGLDLAAGLAGYRVIAGGRTGGAFVDSNLDNIAVVSIPEPATIALLGLGGFLLLARRRRMV